MTTLATIERTTLATITDTNALAIDPSSPEFREHVENGACAIAHEFQEATADIRKNWALIEESIARLNAIFPEENHQTFRIQTRYHGHSRHECHNMETILKQMGVEAWAKLIDRLGVKNLMSIKRRKEFDAQIERGDVPEVSAEAIISTILAMVAEASNFATEAARETLKFLTPHRAEYKTNSGYKIGKRVVLTYMVERWYNGNFHPHHYHEAELNALDGTFHVLDEKGCIKGHRGPLITAILESGNDGRGETDYFKFKCFKNNNLHIEFKRLDLVKKLNGLASGEYVLGEDE